MYRIQEFARLANVTVRTLHHYDRLGLLQPTARSEAGYRLYRMEDLVPLERILVLRYLGLSLRQIADLFADAKSHPEETLADTLARQATVLRERRNGLDRVLRAVEHAQRRLHRNATPDWSLYQSILKEINMQEQHRWRDKYFSPEALEVIAERGASFTPQMQQDFTAHWERLFAEVESAIHRNLAVTSPEARNLADRWMGLVGQFTGGDPQVFRGLEKLYADHENWPDEEKKTNPIRHELMEWIRKVQANRTHPS